MKNVYQMEANASLFECQHISLFKPSVFLIMEIIFQTLWKLCCWKGLQLLAGGITTYVPAGWLCHNCWALLSPYDNQTFISLLSGTLFVFPQMNMRLELCKSMVGWAT